MASTTLEIVCCSGVAAGFVGAAVATYLLAERQHRSLWARVPLPAVQVGDGAYRASAVVAGYASRAPRAVRLAAFASLLLGQMFVPGLLMGLFGLLAIGLGLVSVPGLIVAARVWLSGLHLLSGTPERLRKARASARLSARYNVALSGWCGFAAVGLIALWCTAPGEEAVTVQRDNYIGWLILVAITQGYALVSLAHAWWVDRATAALTAVDDVAAVPAIEVLPAWMRRLLARRRQTRAALASAMP